MLGLFGRKKSPRESQGRWSLSSPLVRWTRDDAWTIGNAVEGTLILGATGSGKSTGSGRTIALAMLRAGFGGLVLTVKPDERSVWERYCREAGRLDDLVVFAPDSDLRFNFLDYELQRKGGGAGLTENIVNLFSTVLEVAERGQGQGSGREDEGYWRRASRQLCRNLVDLAIMADGRISIPGLYAMLVSAPTSVEHARSDGWRKNSLLFHALAKADRNPKTPRQEADFALVADYFLCEWPALSDKTRSVVLSTFTSMIDVLNRGVLGELFSGETNVTPDIVTGGKILVIDLPAKEFADVGQFAQVLWKYTFQRSIERRNVVENPRPVFLWADEAQHFLTSYDMQFAATCRAARVATVILSQNVSNFYAALGGGDKGRAEADSLFANLNSKVFHANGDPVTNEWAASLIGRSRQLFMNGSNSAPTDDMTSLLGMAGLRPPGQTSGGFSESYEFEVQPSAFTQLRTGGPAADWNVDGIVFQNGRLFRGSGRTWLPVTFRQEP